ncbi:MAG: glutamine amidotransferase [Acidithiobacillales bacterium SG8_45]|jgi:GMP synthase-like glutamine amidotransferase|nr:MAG: glutamine amidotransferase [Acidithiobacillales bacterium SG8_45]
MQDILIIRHVAHEGPGYLAEFLKARKIPYRILAIDNGENLPTSIDGFTGLVLMGGPMSVNDDLPWIPPALALVQQALDRDLPVLGHCLGGQLIARAMGASVHANPVPEYGWLPIEVADNSLARQWFPTLTHGFTAFHWHGETFDLPDGATHVWSSDHCRNQAFVVGNTLAMQCHVEMTPKLVQDWVDRADDDTLSTSPSVQNRDTILSGLDQKISEMQSTADDVYGQWLARVLNNTAAGKQK